MVESQSHCHRSCIVLKKYFELINEKSSKEESVIGIGETGLGGGSRLIRDWRHRSSLRQTELGFIEQRSNQPL